MVVRPSITSCPCCWRRVFFGRLGILPMPSVHKPLLFLGSCFFCCTTRGCRGSEKNVCYEPLLFDFLPNTYLSILRAYTYGWEGREEKQQGGETIDALKRILKVKWPNFLIIRWEKMGPKEVLICSKSYRQMGVVRARPRLWIPSIVLISLEPMAPYLLRELLKELASLLQWFLGVGIYFITIDDDKTA